MANYEARHEEAAREALATVASRSTLYPKLATMTVTQLAAWYATDEMKRALRRAAALVRSTARGRARNG